MRLQKNKRCIDCGEFTGFYRTECPSCGSENLENHFVELSTIEKYNGCDSKHD